MMEREEERVGIELDGSDGSDDGSKDGVAVPDPNLSVLNIIATKGDR